MARSKSDISNSAIRIFLQDVGKFYDEERGFEPFVPKVAQKNELLKFFDNKCCFCGTAIDRKSLSQDHLIPMNKSSLGLHAWGNVVPCCKSCNNEKQQKPWANFIKNKAGDFSAERTERINKFVASKKYDPSLNLHKYADNLYEDIGEVAMTLINLRYKQAENGIKQLLAR
jgi:5-methylcytosine-specific restriction endonuclease McrA